MMGTQGAGLVAIKVTTKGLIAAEEGAGGPMKLLLPVNVVVHKKNEAVPLDGVLAQVGDTLVYQATDNPAPWRIPNLSFFWQYRKLRGDGTLGEWEFVDHGWEPNIEVTEPGAGIFQIRFGILTDGGPVYFNYKRWRDDPHGKDSGGHMNPKLKQGEPDYVGIAASEQQWLLAKTARIKLGATAYAERLAVVATPSYTAPPGKPKCNIFVYHMALAAGASVPLDPGGVPPRAYEWWDSSFALAGWTHYSSGNTAEPGTVVSRPSSNIWILQDAIARGHVGILDYDGAWINAGPGNVNRYPHLTDDDYQNANFRKN
jgi:hypothetical protein